MMHHPNWNTASDMKALSSCTNEGGTVLFNVIKPGAMSQDEHFVDSNGSTHGALKPHLVKFMVDLYDDSNVRISSVKGIMP